MKHRPTGELLPTNWDAFDALRDEDIDLSDIPEVTPEMFARAVVRDGLKPRSQKVQPALPAERDPVRRSSPT